MIGSMVDKMQETLDHCHKAVELNTPLVISQQQVLVERLDA